MKYDQNVNMKYNKDYQQKPKNWDANYYLMIRSYIVTVVYIQHKL